ncbi:MAG TPA: hypothetical protein VGU71_10810 [Candidatus Dormibacteraeota bacterium]|nr:hypothetical protein [Candidatus Dormibacteraeota bacterium]
MKASTFLFATDLVDEGTDVVLDRLQRSLLDGLTMACNYHHSRDVFPHNPVHRVRFMQGGVFFRPERSKYENLLIQPDVPGWVLDDDPLENVCRAANRRGLAVRAWTNNMHSTNLALANPNCSVQNAFGDHYITSLCPANPDVRAYVCALNSDLARYPLDALLVESICHMPFDHGYHHERLLVSISPLAKFLLGLCFCEHCMAGVAREGAQAERLRAYVAEQLDRHLGGAASDLDGAELSRPRLAQLAGGDLVGMLVARQSAVTSLIREVKEAVAAVSNIPVLVMEWSGGLRGAGMGMPVGETTTTAPDRAWEDGVDLQQVGGVCDGFGVLGYVRELEALRLDLAAYRKAIGAKGQLSVALRPMPPDCVSPAELAQKIALLNGFAADWVEFYHYGFMRLQNLDWIAEALASQAAAN